MLKLVEKAENDEAKSENYKAKGVPGRRGVTEGDRRWQNEVTEVWWRREVLESVRKMENGGYKTVTDAASSWRPRPSTYVLCPCLWNQVSINFRGSEDNEGDGEQSKDV